MFISDISKSTSSHSSLMWPANPALGSQLTYGVSGNAVLVPDFSPDSDVPPVPSLRFARLADQAPRLHLIKHSSVLIGTKRDEKPLRAPDSHIASTAGELDSLQIESSSLSGAVDPTIGTLSTIFVIANYTSPAGEGELKCFAFAQGSIIKVVPLLPKKRRLLDPDPAKVQKRLIAIPSLAKLTECHFSFDICQVGVSTDLQMIAVRGHNQVAFLAYSWNDSGIQLKRVDSISHPTKNLACFAFQNGKFLLVDAEGTLIHYKFCKSNSKFVENSRFKVDLDEPQDFSSWKGLWWPEPSSCVLLSRKSATKINLEVSVGQESEPEKLVSFHVWSHLQDYAAFGSDMFLFTSKEIIWTRLNDQNKFERLVSWKHFLSDQDMTRKISVNYSHSSKTYTCMVYSAQNPAIIIYTFGLFGGRPSSLRDPYYVESQVSQLKHLSVDETKGIFHICELSEDGNTVTSSYCSEESRSLSSGENLALTREARPVVERKFTSEEESALFERASSGQYTSRVRDSVEQPELVQKYAFRLGEKTNPLFKSVSDEPNTENLHLQTSFSLSSMANKPPSDITDVEEFDSMVEQLEAFYESQGAYMNLRESYGSFFKDFKGISDILSKHEGHHHDKGTVLLKSSLIKARNKDFFGNIESLIATETASCSSDLAHVLDTWELETPEPLSVTSPKKLKSNNLLHRAITNSQIASQPAPDSTQPSAISTESLPEIPPLLRAETQPVLRAEPQAPPSISSSQPVKSSSQTKSKSQPVKRLGSQGSSQKKKKKKGGFA